MSTEESAQMHQDALNLLANMRNDLKLNIGDDLDLHDENLCQKIVKVFVCGHRFQKERGYTFVELGRMEGICIVLKNKHDHLTRTYIATKPGYGDMCKEISRFQGEIMGAVKVFDIISADFLFYLDHEYGTYKTVEHVFQRLAGVDKASDIMSIKLFDRDGPTEIEKGFDEVRSVLVETMGKISLCTCEHELRDYLIVISKAATGLFLDYFRGIHKQQTLTIGVYLQSMYNQAQSMLDLRTSKPRERTRSIPPTMEMRTRTVPQKRRRVTNDF